MNKYDYDVWLWCMVIMFDNDDDDDVWLWCIIVKYYENVWW